MADSNTAGGYDWSLSAEKFRDSIWWGKSFSLSLLST